MLTDTEVARVSPAQVLDCPTALRSQGLCVHQMITLTNYFRLLFRLLLLLLLLLLPLTRLEYKLSK